MKDYDNLCKLVHTSEYLDSSTLLMVTPWDVPPEDAHLPDIQAGVESTLGLLSAALSSHIDLVPTILYLAGITYE